MAITPGPCPPEGCPPPTEIDCIVVDKVYDSCTQTITTTQITPAVGTTCTVTGCSIDLTTSSCTVAAITPSVTPDFNDITFLITVDYAVTCATGPSPVVGPAFVTQVVTLYNPTGTAPSCTILSGACTCINLPDGSISCTLTVCVLFETTATVQLMIPTYGFCAPPVCPTVGPVLPCPPVPLFPPQMT